MSYVRARSDLRIFYFCIWLGLLIFWLYRTNPEIIHFCDNIVVFVILILVIIGTEFAETILPKETKIQGYNGFPSHLKPDIPVKLQQLFDDMTRAKL